VIHTSFSSTSAGGRTSTQRRDPEADNLPAHRAASGSQCWRREGHPSRVTRYAPNRRLRAIRPRAGQYETYSTPAGASVVTVARKVQGVFWDSGLSVLKINFFQ
jgi:hypothetical protein